MNNLIKKISKKNVGKLIIDNDNVAEVESLLVAINDIDNRLADITVNPVNEMTLEYVAKILRRIVKLFGGNLLDTTSLSYQFNITTDDMINGNNTVIVLQTPMENGNINVKIDWE